MKNLLFILLFTSFSYSQTIDVGVGFTQRGYYNFIASRKIYKDFGAFASVIRNQELKGYTIGLNYNVCNNLTFSAGAGAQKTKNGTISIIDKNSITVSPTFKFISSYELAIDYHFLLLAKKNAIGFQVGHGSIISELDNKYIFLNIYYSYSFN